MMGKAFASPVRLELLDLLAQATRTVDELALRDASVARLAEVERAARDYLGPDVDTIGREELIARMRGGDVVLIDVRPREEFDAGHIDGARSIPLAELEQRLAGLPVDREIVAYCRGPFCADAHQAVRPSTPRAAALSVCGEGYRFPYEHRDAAADAATHRRHPG